MNIIGGLDEPTEGNVTIQGTDMFSLKERELIDFRLHHIGFVFQAFNLIPVLTAKENIAFILQMQGRPQKECNERSMELLEMVGLKDKVDKRPSELSGGQQQRLCIARALAVDPDILLMDEPASALDPKSTTRVEDLIGELRGSYTIVIVTHNMQQAARISDYTAFLYMGELIEYGATDALFTNPVEERTESYITGRFG